MNDSIVRCAECNRTEEVNYSACLRRGWPKCCGNTMRLESSPGAETVSAAVADAMRPLSSVLDALKRGRK